ncbi:patatin-like phospholipase family protein [Bradyrhizobium genomosp. III]|uniref:patatin-like phospholipase family protein n=1 Tax=Bradyrhizobium genomosp. III TaxID=2683271 RepID=UPI00057688FE|nr:patatin-like phospholipase family protein [Bradyrhizobium sp. CCBAU 15635]
MPYVIELMAIGEDVYPLLDRAAAALNGVQKQFDFRLTPITLQSDGLGFVRASYLTTDVWSFLREQRQRVGGHRPYIISFVTKPLRSPKFANLFGSHEGGEGLAVVTASHAEQYVKEIVRYYCYYLARYALTFVNPHIRSHEDEARKACYFHFKRRKQDIRISMDAGELCDECRARLDNPWVGDVSAHRLSFDEREALQKMLAYVSGDLPYALVMKGGGVKGLAFAGALVELENFYYFDRHVGASAGALAAVLLAASYTPQELLDLLIEKNFGDFMDAPWWKVPINLAWSRGCFPGESCRLWIADLLTKKISGLGEIPMSALKGALIYAARQRSGTLTFDSYGERKEAVAAFAARCSMSIPFFFYPVLVDGRRVFDGGLRNNFPLTRYLAQEPRSNFIALYLGKSDNTVRHGLITRDLIEIAIDGEERSTVDANQDKVVVIDTSPVGTVDFWLSSLEKQFLLLVGRAAALEYLQTKKFDNGPSPDQVLAIKNEAERSRKAVIEERAKRRKRRFVKVCGTIAVVGISWLAIRFFN